MQFLIDSYKKTKNLHHAYFIVGNKNDIFSNLIFFLESDVGLEISGNPDFWTGKFDNLTIDEARFISESSQKKSFKTNLATELSNKRIFVIITDFISHEAQNSLLKVFEEPTDGTHFFIISPQDNLLPTLRSRMQVIKSENVKVKGEKMSKTVLDMSLKERLERVKKIIESINGAKSNEVGSSDEVTKQDAISFVNSVEEEIYKRGVEISYASLKICSDARLSLLDRGAPIKMILENLVLNI